MLESFNKTSDDGLIGVNIFYTDKNYVKLSKKTKVYFLGNE